MLKVNDILCGFRITRCRSGSEIGGTMVEMRHEKTGGEVCWIDNGNRNKLFAIAFKTLPSDDTGVFHILEHTTLCGSEKYPVREPFVELMKSSMNTFLNAMTGPDYTVYPVSSRSMRDYLNLVSVYLDAVFRPRLMTEKNIFLQEGWHIEETDGQPAFKGVVFNEMKGDMSSPDSVIDDAFSRLLFPDTPDRFNSGGDPALIPTLTWDKYRETYTRFYHPSNARVFLDGSVPLEETLRMLDEYYSAYQKRSDFPENTFQTPRGGKSEARYELPMGEDAANKGCFVMGRIMAPWTDRLKRLAASVLFSVIGSSNDAPLKKAVLDAGLARSVQFSVDPGFQSSVSLTFRDIKDGCEDEIYDLVRREAERIYRTGLDRDELEASIRRMAFSTRDTREPSGLYRLRQVLASWLYGGDPMDRLMYDDVFANLKKMIPSGGYERLLREIILDDHGMCLLTVLPSPTLGEEMRKKEEAMLRGMLDGMTAEERAGLRAETEALLHWQQTPDSPENLATLPTLPLSEVKDAPEWTDTTEYEYDDVRVLYHPVACPGIVHVRTYFSLADASLDDLPWLQLMASMFSHLPTSSHSVQEVRKQVRNLFGRDSINIQAYSRKNCRRECMPFLCASFSCLEEDMDAASDLMHEILAETRFDDLEKVERLARQTALHCRQNVAESGNILAIMKALSPYSAEGAANEALSGITFTRFLSGAAEEIRKDPSHWKSMASRLVQDTFVRERMLVSVSGAADLKPDRLIRSFSPGLPLPSRDTAYSMPAEPMAFIRLPAQVGSAVQAWEPAVPGRLNAACLVGANIISLGYLWNTVRVVGGAYGCSLMCDLSGSLAAYSYRDPTPAATITAYADMENALRAFCEEDGEIDPYILSAIAEAEPLKSPSEQSADADVMGLTGFEREDSLRIRAEMLSCGKKELLEFADLLHAFAAKGCRCIAAPESLMGDTSGAQIMDPIRS